MRVIFYVDGFNFYPLRLSATSELKWLNWVALAERLKQPDEKLISVNFYTARVNVKADRGAPLRQQLLLSAMLTELKMHITYGKFLTSRRWMPLNKSLDTRPQGYNWHLPVPELVAVDRSEEKGSDVNLGAHLLRDGFWIIAIKPMSLLMIPT